jgi:hypothetical protein
MCLKYFYIHIKSYKRGNGDKFEIISEKRIVVGQCY